MKKILCIMMSVLMVFGMLALTACSDNNKPADTTAADTTAADTTAAPAPEADPEDLPVLKMGTNAYFQPYEYYEGEKIIGIDAEIAEAIAKKLGMKLEIKDMAFDSIISAVNAGDVDFGMAGMTVTEKRLLEVDFSISYASGVQSIIVKDGSPITKYEDLAAEGATYKIGTQLGTTGDIYCGDEFGADRVTSYATGNEAVVALLAGDVDCVIIDNEPAKAFVNANAGLMILETAYAEEDYAICVKKGNAELLEKIDTAIKALIADGTVDSIIDKYIK